MLVRSYPQAGDAVPLRVGGAVRADLGFLRQEAPVRAPDVRGFRRRQACRPLLPSPAQRKAELRTLDVDHQRLRHRAPDVPPQGDRSEEHTSELQSLMRTPYAVSCLKKKK